MGIHISCLQLVTSCLLFHCDSKRSAHLISFYPVRVKVTVHQERISDVNNIQYVFSKSMLSAMLSDIFRVNKQLFLFLRPFAETKRQTAEFLTNQNNFSHRDDFTI